MYASREPPDLDHPSSSSWNAAACTLQLDQSTTFPAVPNVSLSRARTEWTDGIKKSICVCVMARPAYATLRVFPSETPDALWKSTRRQRRKEKEKEKEKKKKETSPAWPS
ncbi:hypothetical protein LX32DRAFT_643678 [Colletotrichum zoysiae]|uniref:Uncharacterized protein n=1 Tax=Colletotrichum zoysiae TaxID=1216348 RepID=A0AAD9H8F8_9PEZI|nr:hypothetical protein LX32DRAFT_643678 [Colletotrichum zoysiae]